MDKTKMALNQASRQHGPKATGERYLPEAAIKGLTDKEYKATTRAKEDFKKGKQFSKQPKLLLKNKKV